MQLNLSVGWFVEAFPRSPTVIVLRHPCAAVQSMSEVSWKRPVVGETHSRLAPDGVDQFIELLDGCTSEAAVYAARRAVETRALLRDTDPAVTSLVGYEAGVTDPSGGARNADGGDRFAASHRSVGRHCAAIGHGALRSVTRTEGDPVRAWVDGLSRDQRDEVLAVVAGSGLVGFATDPCPEVDALHEQHRGLTRDP